MNRLRRLSSCQAGASAIEFAIVALLLIVVSLGIIELGRGLNTRNRLAYAADYAARRILTDRLISDSALESEVRSIFDPNRPEDLKIVLGTETVNGVAFRTINLSYPFLPLIPTLSTGTIELKLARRTPAM